MMKKEVKSTIFSCGFRRLPISHTVLPEKTLESPSDCKEIKTVNPKRNQLWLFIGRTDAEAEAPLLWPPDVKTRFIGKDPVAGKDWRQKETRAAEDEMVRQHHCLNGHEWEQTPGDSGGQKSLAAAVHGLAKSRTWLSNWTPTNLTKVTLNRTLENRCSMKSSY